MASGAAKADYSHRPGSDSTPSDCYRLVASRANAGYANAIPGYLIAFCELVSRYTAFNLINLHPICAIILNSLFEIN